MSAWDGLAHRLRTLLRPGQHARDLEDEMRTHVELLQLNRTGDAQAAARLFGNRTMHYEATRALTWLRLTDLVQQDTRTAWRGVWRARGALSFVVLLLAVGIGATAAVFSVFDALYLRLPSGAPGAAQVERYWVEHFRSGDGKPFTSLSLTYGMARALSGDSGQVTRIGLYTSGAPLRLGRAPGGTPVRAVYANADYFRVLGVRPSHGRLYQRDEDAIGAGANVVVLSEAFWRRAFGARTSIIGQPLDLGRERYTVIGIAAGGFEGVELQAADAWIPLSVMPEPPGWWDDTRVFRLRALAPIDDRLSGEAREGKLTTALRAHLREQDGARSDTLARIWIGPVQEARGPTRGPVRPRAETQLASRLGIVCGLVLLLAWANVVNLLLARLTARRREFAMRLALGISRARLARVLVLEAAGIALASTALAAALAWSAGALLRGLLFPSVTWYSSPLSWRVVAFAVGLALLAALTAALLPLRQALALGVTRDLKVGEGGNSAYRSRMRRGLLGLQAALSVVLVMGAVLTVVSLRNIEGLDIGFDRDRLLFGMLTFDEGEAPARAVSAAAARDVVNRLASDPTVERVARSGHEPMMAFGFASFFTDRDSTGSFPGNEPTLSYVSPDFFATVGLAIRQGRAFTGADVDGAPREVVVNEAMARLYWPAGDAIGKCLWFTSRDGPCFVVTGIVETARQSVVLEDPRAQFYVPLGAVSAEAQLTPPSGRVIIVRPRAGWEQVAMQRLTRELREAFPTGIVDVHPMTQTLEGEYQPWRRSALIFSALGILALLVAAGGTYSSVSFEAGRRTRELGVRSALGGSPRALALAVLRGSMGAVSVGVAVGILVSAAAAPGASALLYGIEGTDARALVGVSLLLLSAAAAGCLWPALKATRADPLSALRAD